MSDWEDKEEGPLERIEPAPYKILARFYHDSIINEVTTLTYEDFPYSLGFGESNHPDYYLFDKGVMFFSSGAPVTLDELPTIYWMGYRYDPETVISSLYGEAYYKRGQPLEATHRMHLSFRAFFRAEHDRYYFRVTCTKIEEIAADGTVGPVVFEGELEYPLTPRAPANDSFMTAGNMEQIDSNTTNVYPSYPGTKGYTAWQWATTYRRFDAFVYTPIVIPWGSRYLFDLGLVDYTPTGVRTWPAGTYYEGDTTEEGDVIVLARDIVRPDPILLYASIGMFADDLEHLSDDPNPSSLADYHSTRILWQISMGGPIYVMHPTPYNTIVYGSESRLYGGMDHLESVDSEEGGAVLYSKEDVYPGYYVPGSQYYGDFDRRLEWSSRAAHNPLFWNSFKVQFRVDNGQTHYEELAWVEIVGRSFSFAGKSYVIDSVGWWSRDPGQGDWYYVGGYLGAVLALREL